MDVREIIARALCESDGLTWDEARAPADPNVGTEAEAYAVAADAVLAALEAQWIVLARYGVRYLVPLESLPESEK